MTYGEPPEIRSSRFNESKQMHVIEGLKKDLLQYEKQRQSVWLQSKEFS